MRLRAKVYLDTSIMSAYFDERAFERQNLTKIFWDNRHIYDTFTSVVTLRKIGKTKSLSLREKMEELAEECEILEVTPEILTLAKRYIEAGIIPEKFENDALHIAVASFYNLDYLISWNFAHIVKVRTRRMVNLVNLTMGYKGLEIVSPPEL